MGLPAAVFAALSALSALCAGVGEGGADLANEVPEVADARELLRQNIASQREEVAAHDRDAQHHVAPLGAAAARHARATITRATRVPHVEGRVPHVEGKDCGLRHPPTPSARPSLRGGVGDLLARRCVRRAHLQRFAPSGCTLVTEFGKRPVRKDRRVGLQYRKTSAIRTGGDGLMVQSENGQRRGGAAVEAAV